MKNIYLPEIEITIDDMYFTCSLIERTARTLKQPNAYIVNMLGKQGICEILSAASVLHSENQLGVVADLIDQYELQNGTYDVTVVDPKLVTLIPTVLQMARVYKRLILATMLSTEDFADAIIRVYTDKICLILDDYNGSAYYEPSPFIVRSYYMGTFN